ncbi:Pro-kumamolisin, activation domain-containing protein [Annulohypoxylon maeteangense]|uniref:Pro-kumamolisin, activation domain-containing protein n=1 Tax=Annulohypoxylon maeteangense TaxID=1927788 RepID=UPI0020085D1F|nr:Pro-kumamolisin, activation domain-containing protein [Annulohypoxylon maeteangense]KAI0884159.1 Pro-kumamolisin, activation domain-containing protein [Annulohypoxylon maeteangense]
MLFSLPLSALAAASASASAASTFPPAPHPNSLPHEKRDASPISWSKRTAVDPSAILPMRIGLKQSNLQRGHDLLMDVSRPDSLNYGKYYTAAQVRELFAPAAETVELVRGWLEDAGISRERVSQSANKGWLQFDASTEEAEGLLRTQYHVYQHRDTGSQKIACDEYHLPSHIREHVDYVTPGIKLIPDAEDKKQASMKKQKRASLTKGRVDSPLSLSLTQLNTTNLTTCDTVMTIPCIRALYQIPEFTSTPNPQNQLGIYEFADAWNQIDLDHFFRDFTPSIPAGTAPSVHSIDGGVSPGAQGKGIESLLDLTLAIPLIYPQKTVIYQGLFNNFLDALDGSYCTSSAYEETGNNPDYDYTYPDPASESEGAYKGELQCGVYEPTNVLSISYDWAEAVLPVAYQRRQCDEWLKLGLQGISVVFSSADYGVGGGPDWSVNRSPNACMGTNGTVFNPAYPATCPYVTVAGATYLPPGVNVSSGTGGKSPEVAAYSIGLKSGGGFSNVFPAPTYQEDAVAQYFKAADPIVQEYPYYSTQYNESVGANGGIYNRIGRGYPDISAAGDNMVIYSYNQTVYPIGGTSAAAPIFASVLTLINEARLAANKSTVGFVNPVLYAHPEVLNDVTQGNNSGCGTSGFIASEGWDPVTGLGTPNFPAMLDLWMSLP